MKNKQVLAEFCIEISKEPGVVGVLLLVMRKGNINEVVGAMPSHSANLPAMIRQLADKVEAMGGLPVLAGIFSDPNTSPTDAASN